ncbi:putative Methylase/methyltransferase [Desulfamplus magnetovallimortis]|uniref:Putative Methylase/methyltransferase n=1 Tax=Desulfamplus magnetovallimortis TaxID=1246637 RepID=A0A1W1HF15_9BACT|nr:class I SAM-dependent methyltransferase [Desulfamplus magnetovallimortis]SLM30965.1 putative Methylase/methyltransferase [Desulfamplus magnetovallimortis]
MSNDTWRIWNKRIEYGEILAKRARGDLPEMESSKALAKFIKPIIQPHDQILDVGCGVGHYLNSLDREIELPFNYTGADATEEYIALAKNVWQDRERQADFKVADVFALPFEPESFDIVISANLLLHLPSIVTPLQEMVRVSKRAVVIRTPCAKRCFRIKEVLGKPDDNLFDENGEPKEFYYFNLYSTEYLEAIIKKIAGIAKISIKTDSDFNPENIEAESRYGNRAENTTQMQGKLQANGPILMDWKIILIEKNQQKITLTGS